MALERPPTSASLVDVLDRVLDKGIVIDAWVRVSVVGIDVITIEARVVVASIQTYLQYTNLLATAALASAATLDSVRRTPASRRLIRSSR